MFLRGELPSLAEWRAASGSGAEEASAAEVDPLRTPLEEKLARLWNEVLGIEAKDRREDFFTSGGQSLRASQLAARIRDEFGIDVPMQVLFQRPTIAEQAEWLQIAIDASPTGPRVRHEILRTTFPDDHGRPARRIATTVKIPFACVDLRHKRPGEREADLQRRLRSEAARPFDLAAGPLVRCFVYRLGEQEHVVLLAMHHIICDGWSMGLLLRELGGIYRGLRVCSESSPLPLDGRGAGGEGGWNSEAIRRPLTPNPSPASGRGELLEQTADYIEYADFAAWQKERIAADAFASQLEYWQRQLDGLPPLLELPTDRPRPPQQSFAGSLRKMAISRGTLARLDALARQEKTTRFVVLMAAYNALLNRYSRQEDIAVGTIVANRTRRELENLPGFFANTVVLRTDVSGAPTFRELIARVHRATLEAYANQEVPFEKVVERLQPERFGNRPPLFQVALVLENMPLDLKSMRAWRIERLAIDNGTAKYDLAVLLWEEADQLRGEVEYSTALFDAATVDGMIEALGTLLDAAVQEPDRPVSRLPLVSASLRQRIVSDASDSETHEPLQGLHELFEGQAAATPERIALVCGTRRLSYGELNGEAERVAALLQSRGLRPGEPATVCLPRSAESVIAVLGVLKAGGVYVPLDPDQPAERIAFLLADSGTRLLLARDDLRSRLPATDARVVLWEEIQEEVPSPPAPLPARERGDDSPPAPLPTRERGDDSPPDTLAARERGDVIASPAGPVPARERGARVAYILYTSGSTAGRKGRWSSTVAW